MARTAYSPTSAPVLSPQSVEYEALARVTHHLKKNATGRFEDFPALARAIHHNRRVWTTFASAVADYNNALPADLRARILYLAEFTLLHSQKVLAREESPDPLIDINTAIMKGLRAQCKAP